MVTKSWFENFGERLSNFQQKAFGHFPSRKVQNLNQKGRKILEISQPKIWKRNDSKKSCVFNFGSFSQDGLDVRTRWFPVVLCHSPWRSCLWRAWQRSGPWGVISKNIIRISRYLQRFCWSYGELVITSSVKCLTSNFAPQLVNYNDTLQNSAPSTWNRES